jgi:hypothetical protein
MTAPGTDRRRSRRTLLAGLALVLLLLAGWIGYVLSTFDLDSYRRQLEQTLSANLSLPVSIDAIDYRFHDTRLALHIAGIEVGDDQSRLSASLPNALLDLRWIGLLSGQLRFARVSLEQPRLNLVSSDRLADEQPDRATAPPLIDSALLQRLSIDELNVVDGLVAVASSTADGERAPLATIAVAGTASDLRLGGTLVVDLSGRVEQAGAVAIESWQLLGDCSPKLRDESGLDPACELNLDADEVDFAAIRQLFAGYGGEFAAAGVADLSLRLALTTEQADLQVVIGNGAFSVTPGGLLKQPLRSRSLVLSGLLSYRGEQRGIDNLAIRTDGIRLAGAVRWSPQGEPLNITAELKNSRLAGNGLRQLLSVAPSFAGVIGDGLQESDGTLHIASARAAASRRESGWSWQLDELDGEASGLLWQRGESPLIDIRSLPFRFSDGSWSTAQGRIGIGTTELRLDGSGSVSSEGVTVAGLDLSATAEAQRLLEEWFPTRPESLQLNGDIPIKLHAEGPYDKLKLELKAALSGLGLRSGEGVRVKAEAGDSLTLQATLSPERLLIDHGVIKLNAVEGRINGSYLPGRAERLELDAQLSVNDLSRLAESVPALTRWQLRGGADLLLTQRGRFDQNPPQVTLTLRDAGLHASRMIADIVKINGRFKLRKDSLVGAKLRAHLGESPVTIKASLEGLSSSPHLFIDVSAPVMRAQDLVFNSPTAVLRDVKGQLEIDRDGLTFERVDVRLDGGTDASVKGYITFAPPLDVQLNISSQNALIGEVVALWSGQAGPAARSRGADNGQGRGQESGQNRDQHPPASVAIRATIERGDLYGMRFHDAAGVIRPGHGQLVIEPLDFAVGDGTCKARVVTEYQRKPATLRISGQVSEVDALEVYRELLKQKSIVRGKLSGDFRIDGEIGETYLSSSSGRFDVTIDKGVLHKFQILSKVFSLLNVSQIFTLQLPDMAGEGMPFDQLTGNFTLEHGILKSDDLRIASRAMNQAYSGQLDLINKQIDLAMAIQPLGTVDTVLSRIPIAGWLLTGDEGALLSAHFKISGEISDAEVEVMPLDTLSRPTIGLLRRTLGLPFKLFDDPQILWGGKAKEQDKDVPPPPPQEQKQAE